MQFLEGGDLGHPGSAIVLHMRLFQVNTLLKKVCFWLCSRCSNSSCAASLGAAQLQIVIKQTKHTKLFALMYMVSNRFAHKFHQQLYAPINDRNLIGLHVLIHLIISEV